MGGAITQEVYENGLRCRGICGICKDKLNCYQFLINENLPTEKINSPFIQNITKTVKLDVQIDLTTNDIFNWITECDSAKDLKYLARYARKCANILEDPDDDDFRSRA